jgi:exonuclease VII large subunit
VSSKLPETTIEATVTTNAVKRIAFEQVIVDTTVQGRATAHRIDCRLHSLSEEPGCKVLVDFSDRE